MRALLPYRRHDRDDDQPVGRPENDRDAAVRREIVARSRPEGTRHARVRRAHDDEAVARRPQLLEDRLREPDESRLRRRRQAALRSPPRVGTLPTEPAARSNPPAHRYSTTP